MNAQDAEEYTQSLGQIVSGGWRQIALGEKLGVPKALGLSTEDWVKSRLGGYVRLSIAERREAVSELAEEGRSNRDIAGVLGVSKDTVRNDKAGDKSPGDQKNPKNNDGDDEDGGENSPDDDLAPSEIEGNNVTAYLLRADQAVQFARDARVLFPKFAVTAKHVAAARTVVSTWNNLVHDMERALGKEKD